MPPSSESSSSLFLPLLSLATAACGGGVDAGCQCGAGGAGGGGGGVGRAFELPCLGFVAAAPAFPRLGLGVAFFLAILKNDSHT